MATAVDPLADRTPGDTAPGDDGFAITPSDTPGDELPAVVRAIWVGNDGDLKLKTERGTTLLFKAVPVGLFTGLRVRQVFATDTTAGDLVGIP